MNASHHSLYAVADRPRGGEQLSVDELRMSAQDAPSRALEAPMTRITEEDFFVGLFASLAGKGFRVFSLRNGSFERAVAKVFNKLKRMARGGRYDVRFLIRLEDFHGDSVAIRDAVATAASDGILSLDNPVYQDIRLKISPEESDEFLKGLPGGRALYEELSGEFERAYSG